MFLDDSEELEGECFMKKMIICVLMLVMLFCMSGCPKDPIVKVKVFTFSPEFEIIDIIDVDNGDFIKAPGVTIVEVCGAEVSGFRVDYTPDPTSVAKTFEVTDLWWLLPQAIFNIASWVDWESVNNDMLCGGENNDGDCLHFALPMWRETETALVSFETPNGPFFIVLKGLGELSVEGEGEGESSIEGQAGEGEVDGEISEGEYEGEAEGEGEGEAPAFVVAPTNQEVEIKESVLFSFEVSGDLPMSHQWFKNGTPLLPLFSEPLDLPEREWMFGVGPVNMDDAGIYKLLVSNDFGSVSVSVELAVTTSDEGEGEGQSGEGEGEGEPPVQTTVPSVVGDQLSVATSKLTVAMLGNTVTQVWSTSPVGQVLAQNPTAGTVVLRNSIVALTVSKGTDPSTQTTVPSVVGDQLSVATSKLTVAMLGNTVTQVWSTSPVGQVLAQNPGAGVVVLRNSIVALTVSKGTEETEGEDCLVIPDVYGEFWFTACLSLDVDFDPHTVAISNHEVAEGTVVSTDPPAGSCVAKDTYIIVYVATSQF